MMKIGNKITILIILDNSVRMRMTTLLRSARYTNAFIIPIYPISYYVIKSYRVNDYTIVMRKKGKRRGDFLPDKGAMLFVTGAITSNISLAASECRPPLLGKLSFLG